MPPPLTRRVSIPSPPDIQPEDIFSSALGNTFTDDAPNSHGSPGDGLIYHSPRFGKIQLKVPIHPDEEGGRQLFAHYLWNAAVVCAEGIETGSSGGKLREANLGPPASEDEEGAGRKEWDSRHWDVRGKAVLELGADYVSLKLTPPSGTALPSLIAARSGAATISITDHPDSPAIKGGSISEAVRENFHPNSQTYSANVFVQPYIWGDVHSAIIPHIRGGMFDKIIVADCLWMPGQHSNLANTIGHCLRPMVGGEEERGGGLAVNGSGAVDGETPVPCAFVVAGFHTGRAVVAGFFETAVNDAGLAIEEIYEVDVSSDVGEGGEMVRREWVKEREGETKDMAKRWCVVAILTRSTRSDLCGM